jgi:hypothetical protein
MLWAPQRCILEKDGRAVQLAAALRGHTVAFPRLRDLLPRPMPGGRTDSLPLLLWFEYFS